jgi:peptidoglycan/LPS O-acetylase OafA/YrhL
VFHYLREHLEYLLRPNRFLNVDALRACAVLLVVFHHISTFVPAFAHGALGDFCRFGARGVDLFFVISGFLFGSMLLGELQKTDTINMKRFYRHRFLRIVPLYWFATIVSVPLCFWVGWCTASTLPIVPQQLALDLSFLHTLQGSQTAMQAWASWSLVIEIWFYLFIPITLVGLHRASKGKEKSLVIMLGLLALAGFLVRAALVGPVGPAITDRSVWLAASKPYARFDELLIGVLAYILGRKAPASVYKPLLCIGGLILAATYQAMAKPLWSEQWSLVIDWVVFPTVLSIGFSCLLIGSQASRFQHSLITFIANLSYSLYLMHAMLTLIVSNQVHTETFALLFVAGSLVMAYLASAFVEYPFLKMYKRPVATSEQSTPRSLSPIKLGSNLSRV